MAVFEVVIVLLLVGAALAGWARRVNAPYPALVALAGAGLALVPNVPAVVLDPELALALFVAPVLLDAAFDASPRDLRENWRPVAMLALLAVALTVAAVAVVARWIVPGMPWAVAIALGAIVAPPDAAAATAVLKQLRPPHRLLIILEGESLFNDASALLIYRLAVAAAVTGAVAGWGALPMLVGVTAGSVLLGIVLAKGMVRVLPRVEDVATTVIVQFIGTFGVWIIAERVHLSGILTVVAFAMTAARTAPDRTPARLRIPSYAVWEVAVFVLNVLAFILVGLQLKPILVGLDRGEALTYTTVALAVCAAVVLVRVACVMTAAVLADRRHRRAPAAAAAVPPDEGGPAAAPGGVRRLSPSVRAAAVTAWCGMRGTVTLAAALALPTGTDGGGAEFPSRDLVLFTAFAVVLGTLVLQGLTLRPLMLWLGLEDDGEVEREVRLARVETIAAAVESLATVRPATETVALLRKKYETQLRHAQAALTAARAGAPTAASSGSDGDAPADGDGALRRDGLTIREALAAERRRLSALRTDGTIGDDAFHKVEEELDWAELNVDATYRLR